MGRRYSSAQYLAKLEPLVDFNLTADVIVGFPGEDDAAFERTLAVVERAGITPVHVFPYSPRPGTATAGDDSVPAAVKKERGARLRALSDELSPPAVGDGGRDDRPRARRSAGPWVRRRLHAVARSTPRWASFVTRAPSESRRRGSLPSPPEDCLFCRLVAEGDHVHSADGFVAIRDINPIAETHLLVLPVRHVDTFRDIDAFPDDEAGRMLRFVAETARRCRDSSDYKVLVNVGERPAAQTIFHLHWHVLGWPLLDTRQRSSRWSARTGDGAMSLASPRIEDELKQAARLARDEDRRDALSLVLNSLQAAQKELQRPLSDDEELQVLQRERKRRLEAAEAFRAGGREEQAEDEEYELEVLEEFMPEPLSEEEIEEIIDDVISEVGATNIRDMGRVMAGVMHQVSGRADGSTVSQLVKEKLA